MISIAYPASCPTLLVGPTVIAVAWIAYRPFVAVAVLAAGIALAAGILYLRGGPGGRTRMTERAGWA